MTDTGRGVPGSDLVERIREAVENTADPGGALSRIAPVIEADPSIVDDPEKLQLAATLAGASRALTSAIAANPELLDAGTSFDSTSMRLNATLVHTGGKDLAGTLEMSQATFRFSAVIDVLVADALAASVASLSERHPVLTQLPFAVVGMGKWGAQELNYRSDIDLMFVHDVVPGHEVETRAAALALASRLVAELSAPTFDGPSLLVDLDLRPEGSTGPLTRSLGSYRSYYARWAEAWELQALLKARPVAGDPDLGERFEALAAEVVWERGLDADALRSIRQLKSQAEDQASPLDVKRSRGGIRDVEFSVQLLQLVHGRFDDDLRVRGTLAAIEALGEHGYVTAEESAALTDAYVFLRDVEHRLQLWDMEQTHELPTAEVDRARLGRSLGFTGDPAAAFDKRLELVRREVRSLHERLYFRPILDSLAGVPSARLEPADAELRLEVLGFGDTVAARIAFEELTAGLSRRSRVMHQILPLTLDWLSLSPDPDLGLAQLRLLLAHSPDHSALVTLLQNNPLAGERLCLLLGTGRLLGDLIDRIPEFVPRLGNDESINDVRDSVGAKERLIGLLDSRPDPDAKTGTIRRFTRRRKLRIATRDVLGSAPTASTLEALSDSADAAAAGALHAITEGAPTGFGIIAMGKWGGRELSYGSDLDVMYVCSDEVETEQARETALSMSRVLSEPSKHGVAYDLDAGLRPEGRSGPLARSLQSYRRYYEEWAEAWELLALVKARSVAGDASVLDDFSQLLEPVLWRSPLPEQVERDIRSIKARVEAERIPTDEDPDFHLKLGPGGISDVEFLTQLLQLRHGGLDTSLRVPSTLDALQRLREAEILGASEHSALRDAYLFCTRVRLRLHLQHGRATDSLPTSPAALSKLAISLDFDRTGELREQYRRHTRKARRTFESLFYE